MCLPNLEPPDPCEELAVADYAHDRAMRRKQKIVEAHSRLRRVWVSMRILRSYCGRVEERCSGDRVHAKAENIERGEVYGEAEGGFALVVRNGLWVEATRLQIV